MRTLTQPRNAAAYIARVKASNEAFKEMTPAQKRVAIAEDVLALMKSRLIIPTNGCYLEAQEWPKLDAKSAATATGLAQIARAQCQVCAKGSLFVATVCRTNAISVEEVTDSDNASMTWKVVEDEGIFSEDQWDSIEAAFEGSNEGYYFYRDYWLYLEELENYAVFNLPGQLGISGAQSNVLLAAICLNIIDGRGNFDPNRLPAFNRVLANAALSDAQVSAIKAGRRRERRERALAKRERALAKRERALAKRAPAFD